LFNLNSKAMILVRDVFRLKFGKARDVKALMQESKKLMDPEMLKSSRMMFDLVGPSYTMVMETTHADLAGFETSMGKATNLDGWRDWYMKFIPLVESSYREIFTIEP
jgi:hypothetical protein